MSDNNESTNPHEYYICRPDTNPAKLAMGVHPVGTPFEPFEFEGETFYFINGKYWQRGHAGCDGKGLYVVYYRLKGEFKGYGV